MSSENCLEFCFNRGCGKKYDPNNNKEEHNLYTCNWYGLCAYQHKVADVSLCGYVHIHKIPPENLQHPRKRAFKVFMYTATQHYFRDCIYHPGLPVFHDAYKGWSCCKKKCIDFTEFLNIKGCTKSCHSNVKPAEPPKPKIDIKDEVIEVKPKALKTEPPMERPAFDAPQLTLVPSITASLLEEMKTLTEYVDDEINELKVAIGQSCKNNTCKGTYNGPQSNKETCIYHPGLPVFHDGLKYWSCCKKKTSEFSAFLDQKGCTNGNHLWIQKKGKKKACRMDWHQTGLHIIVSIYAKKYHPHSSSVKLNPIHLTINLYFPEEDSTHTMDLELRGIVDVENSHVTMTPTKVEIRLKKKEPGSWAKLDFPRESANVEMKEDKPMCNLPEQVDAVNLNDL